jgi:hypothetical protein
MTQMERMALAVGSTFPRYHVYLSTEDMSHEELARAFNRFRFIVEQATGEPLVYWGVYGNGAGDGGEHLHLLLWKKPDVKRVWHPARKAVGIGYTTSIPIARDRDHALRAAAYVAGQQGPVFGSREHDHAVERRSERSWVMPQSKTLAKHHPDLLRASQAAKNKSMTDERLFASLPGLFGPLTPCQKGCVRVMVADAEAWRKRRAGRPRARARTEAPRPTPRERKTSAGSDEE